MRKTTIAILTLSAFISCNSITSTDSLKEIAVTAVNCVETKSYVKDETLSDSGKPRDIHLSAYNTTLSLPFFLGKTFKNTAGAVWTNHEGDVPAPLYWPQNAKMNFLAYSTGSSTPKAAWSFSDNASKMILDVTAGSLQDDILFAASDDCSSDEPTVSLDFKHSQAWLEFEIAAPAMDITSFHGVTINNVFTSGILTITDNCGLAQASWDFSSTMPADYFLEPDWAACPAPTSSISLSILLPQQQCRPFKFQFNIGGVDVACPCEHNESEYWYSSVHYKYKIDVAGGIIHASTKSASVMGDIHFNISKTEQNWD